MLPQDLGTTRTPPSEPISACLAHTGNCLTQSNKSRTGGKATKKRNRKNGETPQ